jgi:hypothetical protein
MDQNPDLHAKWVGLKVVYVDSADASPVLGVVKKSKKQNQQASFKLLLDGGSTVWLNAMNTAGAALARREFDEAQQALGFPSTEVVVAELLCGQDRHQPWKEPQSSRCFARFVAC